MFDKYLIILLETDHYDATIDLIFLDIQMKLANGLRTAERIRQMDIFLTTLM